MATSRRPQSRVLVFPLVVLLAASLAARATASESDVTHRERAASDVAALNPSTGPGATPARSRSPATTPVPDPASEPSATPSAGAGSTPVPQPARTGSLELEPALVIADVAAVDVTETSADITWTVSVPATGQVEYGLTTAYGTRTPAETSYDYWTHVQKVSGLMPGTGYHFRMISRDAAGRTVTSDDHTFVTRGAAPPPGQLAVYGPGIASDAKANLEIGPMGSVSQRFTASTSAPLESVRWAQRFGPGGYSGGTGGTITITIQEDASGVPSGTVLATGSYRPATSDLPLDASRYYAQAFASPPSLAPGRTYHVVYENTDPAPTSNWVSINSIFVYEASSARQPGVADAVAVLRRPIGGWWSVERQLTPVIDLAYADRTHDGQGYIEPMFGHYGIIDGDAHVRERFTPTGDREVAGAFVRVKRIAGSAPLVVQLEVAGTVLASAVVDEAASIPATPLPSEETLEGARWVAARFASPVRLEAGTTYDLHLSTAAGTTYAAVPIRAGTDGGGTGIQHALRSRVFGDGRAQQSSDGGGSWRHLYEWSPANLQFYLEVTGG